MLLWHAAVGQSTTVQQIQQLHLAYARQLARAQLLQASQPASSEATTYVQAVQTWFLSDLPATVQGGTAEDFFTSHHALLLNRLTARRPLLPVQVAARDSSAAHLRQLLALTHTAHRLPEAAQLQAVKRLTAREQALLNRVRAQMGH